MKWLFCLLPLVMLFIGCGEDDKIVNNTPAARIWPLEVGNEWIYEDRELDSAGNPIRVDTSFILVDKDTLIGNERWYIITANGVRSQEIGLIGNRGDGLWQGGPSGNLVFRYPVTLADTLVFGENTATVESIHDTVTVPAGTFVCINYKWTGGDDSERPYQFHYMSPSVGFIKAEEFHETGSGYIYPYYRSVLISYQLH